MNHATLTTGASPALADRLPVAGLLALAMTGFICIVTETLPAGLLPQISAGLGISAALAGQMVTAYALGSLLAAIPLTIATRGWRRRNVLLLTIIGFLVFNTVTALSTHYWLTLAARFFAGMAAGLAWSLLAGYARRMVAPQQQGRALALAMVGTPAALSLGVPLGTLLGSLVGWRAAFWIISALTLILVAWVLASRAVFATTAVVLGIASHLPAVVYLGMAVWGLSFGGAATLLQTALADTAGSGADVALSMNVVAWNGAIAAAGVVGGALLETWGAGAFPWAMVALLLLAFTVAWSASAHGFRPGRRSGGAPVAGH